MNAKLIPQNLPNLDQTRKLVPQNRPHLLKTQKFIPRNSLFLDLSIAKINSAKISARENFCP